MIAVSGEHTGQKASLAVTSAASDGGEAML